MSEFTLRRATSDGSCEFERYKALESIPENDEVRQAECSCCGLKEDCTVDYISKIENSYSGNWVCGLCSEAVKERLARGPKIAMQEAVSSHRDFCQVFNSTTRLDPKLSLACTMRDIAKRNHQSRNYKISSVSKLARSSSCVPRIDLTNS